MKRLDPVRWARWLLAPAALWALLVLVPCSLAFIKQRYLKSSEFIFWHNADFWVPCIGGVICGLAWMAILVCIVPSRKLTAAAASFPFGAWLAWCLIGEVQYRAGDFSDPWFQTRAPVYLTWWAGLAGLALMGFRARRRSPAAPRPPARSPGAGILLLAAGVVTFCGLVVPSAFLFYRWALYHAALHAIADDGNPTTALRKVRSFAAMPGFELDWTPGSILTYVPLSFTVDQELFGCPTCRGIHNTLTQAAARHGRSDVLEWMLGRRGSMEYWNDRGARLLTAAIGSGNVATVDLLIRRGADVTATNLFPGAMCNAVSSRAPEAVLDRLLAAGAPINRVLHTGFTPLDCAQIWEPQYVPYLLRHGATNAVVRVQLVPFPPGDRRFRFEGTDLGITLPEAFSPINRLQTPPDCSAWEVRAPRAELRFGIGKEMKPREGNTKAAEIDFHGCAAILSHEEYDWNDGTWSAHGNIVFDSSGLTHEALRSQGKAPRYDAVVEYMALSRREMRPVREALGGFFRIGNP